MGLPRPPKGTAPADDLPFLLQHHLPKRARTLLYPLSDDDRQVLTYMLAFGLHLQMLAGAALPPQSLPQLNPRASPSKAVSKLELRFGRQSLPSSSSKSRLRPGKASLILQHKTSCSCSCFSCYSSFWSRWAASPNRDLVSAIIEMAEVADDEEGLLWPKGKESAKKLSKERAPVKGKKSNSKKWKPQGLQDSPKCGGSLLPSSELDKSLSESLGSSRLIVSTSMNLSKGALLRSVQLGDGQAANFERGCMDAKLKVHLGSLVTDASGMVTILSSGEFPVTAYEQPQTTVASASWVDESCPFRLASGDILRCNTVSKLPCVSKRKSNQVTTLNMQATFGDKVEDGEFSDVSECREGSSSPNLVVGVTTTECGVLSRILPHTLCAIVSRLWELVSLGSWSHIESY